MSYEDHFMFKSVHRDREIGYRPCRRLNWHKNRPKIPYCCLLLPRFFVTSVTSKGYGGSVWESKLLGADSTSTSEEALGRNWKDLASFGTLIAAFLPPRFLIPLFSSEEPFQRLCCYPPA